MDFHMRQRRKIPSQERLRELFSYDPDTGIFTRRINRHGGRWMAGTVVGSLTPDGYININVDHTVYRAHRLAWRYMTGEEPADGIDHINGIRHDNRWVNLRESTQQQNLCNTATRKSILGVKGVSFTKEGRFRARIQVNGKAKQIGEYDTIEDAKKARDAVAKALHGEFFRS